MSSTPSAPFILPESLNLPPMKTHPLLPSGWAQTIASAIVPIAKTNLRLRRHVVPLDDGDSTILSEVLSTTLNPKARICLLVHGLAGSESSPYITRLADVLLKKGYRPFLMNLRGCGPSRGLSKSIYHSGRSDDTRRALKLIQSLFPSARITQIGFSLGGNITLKMAGEDGAQPTGNLDSCIAVSAPLDLASCVRKLNQKKNFVFDQFFVQILRLDIWKRHQMFPELGPLNLPLHLTLKQFDDIYTGPYSGYKDGADYYSHCSSLQFVPGIQIPTLMISSFDDPIIETSFYQKLKPQPVLSVLLTKTGGHVGFLTLAGGQKIPEAWHDKAIINWLQKLETSIRTGDALDKSETKG